MTVSLPPGTVLFFAGCLFGSGVRWLSQHRRHRRQREYIWGLLFSFRVCLKIRVSLRPWLVELALSHRCVAFGSAGLASSQIWFSRHHSFPIVVSLEAVSFSKFVGGGWRPLGLVPECSRSGLFFFPLVVVW
ncbi:unnamed protein product [Arabis nemorensis]|uniref:Uncharacterized protein n=1 Tax=Arabis nemorensis TaxID=586526 RepID=A0A565C5G6_9BRAS|nr:unnamed protein product [Arabis nemorensis]